VFRISLAVSLVLINVLPVAAGVLFEIETQDHEQNPSRTYTSRVAVEGRRLTMDISPGQIGQKGGAMLFRGDSREMAIVNHDDKTFFVIDPATIKQLAGQVNQALGQMEEALRSVPENQRAMVEQMMKERMPAQQPTQQAPVEVRAMNQKAEVYGYPCQLYEVRRDGRKIRDLWVTPWSNIDGGRELAPVFADLGEFQQELLAAMPKMGATGGMEDNSFSTMKQIDGFPVASRDYAEDGTVKSESALRSAKSVRVNPAAFAPPAGYQRQNMLGSGK
jgi:hypothetical protein